MAYTRALYYPSIDVTNELWLKNALLYWDEINTIVPNSIEHPYSQPTTQYLYDEGILKPIRVNSDMTLISEIAEDALRYLHTAEGFQVLNPITARNKRNQVQEESPFLARDLGFAYLYPEKMSGRLIAELSYYFDGNEPIAVNRLFANYYMTLLANKLCETYVLSPLTDDPEISNFGGLYRLDNVAKIARFRGLYEGNRKHRETILLAQGALIDVCLKGITIRDSVSIDDILRFKREHQDELGFFRTNIEALTKNIPQNVTIEQLQQYINDIYYNDFLPGYNNLKKSLDSSKIKWIAQNFMKVSFFSTSATTLPTALLGLSVPTALFAGAAISIISSAILYNKEKQEILRDNPYSYLLSIKKNTLFHQR